MRSHGMYDFMNPVLNNFRLICFKLNLVDMQNGLSGENAVLLVAEEYRNVQERAQIHLQLGAGRHVPIRA